MKIINLPTPVFETGERVVYLKKPCTVVHDELEGILEEDKTREQVAENAKYRQGVIIIANGAQRDIIAGRYELELLEETNGK